MICENEKCKKEFKPNKKTQKFCCSKCCLAKIQRNFRIKTSNPCLDCGKPTNAKKQRCRPCSNKHRCFISADMTLEDYYASMEFIKKNSHLKNVQVRLYAKYHNKSLVGLPCQKCGYNKHTNFCHIKPITSFQLTAKISEVNHNSNLLILCPNCHWELDHGLLDPKNIPSR